MELDSYVNNFLRKSENSYPPNIKKQLIWRQKQIDIFYNTGRPIFKNLHDSNHIFFKKNNNKLIGSYY